MGGHDAPPGNTVQHVWYDACPWMTPKEPYKSNANGPVCGRQTGPFSMHISHSNDMVWLSGYTLGKVNSALRSNPPTHVGTFPAYLQ